MRSFACISMSQIAVGVTLAALLASLGCSSTGGLGTLFPSGDFLLRETKDVQRQVSPSLPVPRELQKTALPSYVIQPGDQIVVEPLKVDSDLRFPVDQTVMPDGTIDLAQFGRLVVAGKTIEHIEADVSAAIKTRP